MNTFSLPIIVLGIFALMAEGVEAHQDPWGDIHPIVLVENGNFAIYFQHSQPDAEQYSYTGELPQFRVVYSKIGRLMAPRHPAPTQVAEERHAPGIYGTVLRVGHEQLIFTQTLMRERPSYLELAHGRTERRRLAWPSGLKLNYVHDVHAVGRSLVFAATVGEATLKLFHFSRDAFDAPAVAELGHAATIYDFPRASNLVYSGERYWIGWMRLDPKTEKTVTVLTSWKPGEQPAHRELALPSDWNVELSLAENDGHLCLAYHCAAADTGKSRIITHFQKLAP
jgi:hypothetical protein